MGIHRRTVLWGTVLTASLAGCTGDDGEQNGGDDPGGDADGMTGDGDDRGLEDGANDSEGGIGTGSTNETDGGAAIDAASGTVQTVEHEEFGSLLVDADGTTLYQFDDDQQGAEESACTDDCAETWPPLTVDGEEPTTGEEVGVELTTFEREDGDRQVAADGWPLYYYAGDEEPGDAAGQGADGLWWVVRPDGTANRSESGEEAEMPG